MSYYRQPAYDNSLLKNRTALPINLSARLQSWSSEVFNSDLHIKGLAWLIFVFSIYLMRSSDSVCWFFRSHVQHLS